MKLEEALKKIFSMHQFHIKLGLDNINKLLNHIGNPQKELKAFHIAGSNGKGTTASFIASILQEAGYKVGLYTSPHFIKFNERVRINGEMIPDEYIAKFISDIEEYIDKEEPTFFEITTALAFKYFAEQNVEYVVIETGLGGRLDATNTLDPLATVITSISYEHTNILGEKLSEIAEEKAGICKSDKNLFLGKLPSEATEVIKTKAKKLNNNIFELEKISQINKDSVHIKNVANIYSVPLKGFYQLLNAALAVLTVKTTLEIKDFNVINNGIRNVIKNSGIQGRYEVISENPKVIFDAAHNIEGIDCFLQEYKKEQKHYKKSSVIFGGMKDKNLSEMLKKLSCVFDNIYVTDINYERAANFDEFKLIAEQNNLSLNYLPTPVSFINNFRKQNINECLVVLGSIYLLGEIKAGMS